MWTIQRFLVRIIKRKRSAYVSVRFNYVSNQKHLPCLFLAFLLFCRFCSIRRWLSGRLRVWVKFAVICLVSHTLCARDFQPD